MTTATTNTATTNATKASKTTKAKATKETPILEQFTKLKEKHPDAVLLFRAGDFYETYNEDAETTANVLGITLTNRTTNGEKIKMSGFPCPALDTYLPRLIRAGHRVAICDNLTDKTQKVISPTETQTKEPETMVELKEETPEEIAERKAKELQSTLQKLATLQELNSRRSKFIATLDQLTNAENLLSQKAEIDSEQITYSIDFASGETRYNREKLFSITHQEIVLDFVRYLSEKIKDKVATLEAQIIAV